MFGRILGCGGEGFLSLLLYRRSFGVDRGIKLSALHIEAWGYLGRWDDENKGFLVSPFLDELAVMFVNVGETYL